MNDRVRPSGGLELEDCTLALSAATLGGTKNKCTENESLTQRVRPVRAVRGRAEVVDGTQDPRVGRGIHGPAVMNAPCVGCTVTSLWTGVWVRSVRTGEAADNGFGPHPSGEGIRQVEDSAVSGGSPIFRTAKEAIGMQPPIRGHPPCRGRPVGP